MRSRSSLGQNFFNHQPTVDKICTLIKKHRPKAILEIGPGEGAFTIPLSLHTAQVIAIEKDPYLCSRLLSTLSEKKVNNVTVIEGDILEFNVDIFFKAPCLVFGSLPFNISKPIIRKFLTLMPSQLTYMYVIIQKEVAENYLANPPKGTYLSNFARLYSTPSFHCDIPKSYFSPVPAVDAALISFKKKAPPEHHEPLDLFIQKLFKYPRKTLRNNLQAIIDPSTPADIGSNSTSLLSKRPAEATLEDFSQLFFVYNKALT